MDPERRKALQKTQKKCIAAQVVMCAAYISAGILLAVTGRHCVADIPIYIAGAVITENLQDDMTGAAQAAPVVPEKGMIRK